MENPLDLKTSSRRPNRMGRLLVSALFVVSIGAYQLSATHAAPGQLTPRRSRAARCRSMRYGTALRPCSARPILPARGAQA